jgi:putative hydrolase of the HAD superfamily
LAHKQGKTKKEILDILLPIEDKVAVAKIDYKECLRELVDATGDAEEVQILERRFPIKPEFRALLTELKENYRLALLSNDRGDFEDKNSVWQMEKYFGENIFLSSKMRLRKPGKEFFEYALDKMSLNPKEVLFVDDKERNLDTARGLGMNVIQFKSLEQLRTDLDKMLKEQNVEK